MRRLKNKAKSAFSIVMQIVIQTHSKFRRIDSCMHLVYVYLHLYRIRACLVSSTTTTTPHCDLRASDTNNTLALLAVRFGLLFAFDLCAIRVNARECVKVLICLHVLYYTYMCWLRSRERTFRHTNSMSLP